MSDWSPCICCHTNVSFNFVVIMCLLNKVIVYDYYRLECYQHKDKWEYIILFYIYNWIHVTYTS